MQQTKRTIKKEKTQFRLPQINSTINNRRRKAKYSSRSSGSTKKNNTQISFLATTLNEIPHLKVDNTLGIGIFKDGGTAEQLIKDIYPIIKDDIDIFLHTKYFTEDTEPIDFAQWMLTMYSYSQNNSNWSVEYEEDKFLLKTIVDYNNDEIGHSCELDFLPKLERVNLNLSEMLIGTFSLLYRKFDIPFYFNEDIDHCVCIAEENISEMENEKDDDDRAYVKHLKQQIEYYTVGDPIICGDKIKESGVSIEKLNSYVSVFKPKEDYEVRIIEIIKHSLEIINNYHEPFHNYVHFTEEEKSDGLPGSPYGYAMMGWSYSGGRFLNDILEQDMEDRFQSDCEMFGTIPFRRLIVNNEHDKECKFPFEYLKLLNNLCSLEQVIERL